MKYSENAQQVYQRLYLRESESIEDCHWRIAGALANSDDQARHWKSLLDSQAVRLNTPCMINAGIDNGECWHACFILGLEDSMDSIIEMWETVARIYKAGGGAGIPIGNLRPRGAPIASGGYASGPLSYLYVVQAIADSVRSGGRSRRAANIATMPYMHADIFDFINCKGDGSLQAFNLSVLVDDDFFVNLSAHKELWEAICTKAWECGDPGLLFYDTVNKTNYAPWLGEIRTTNPCGEVAGPPWTVCCLGHINLVKCLKYDKHSGTPQLDWNALRALVHELTYMLNEMLNRSPYSSERFAKVAKATRPIGLGLMGFADVLYILGLPYDSQEAINLFGRICRTLTTEAWKASNEYAETYGVECEVPDNWKSYFKELQEYYLGKGQALWPVANATVTCIAPTGSTAISADCSYSFEPQFALVWEKKLSDGSTMHFTNPYFLEAATRKGIRLTDKQLEQIASHQGSIQSLDFPDSLKRIFKCAHDIHWRDRLRMQASGQRWITQSISSTINLPHTIGVETIGEVYREAWELGLKGITVFRDGCLDSQPVNFGSVEATSKQKRPPVLEGRTHKLLTGDGTLYLTVNNHEGRPFEVFVTIGKGGHNEAANAEAIGRLVSLCLRSNVPMESIVKQLEGIGGNTPIFQEGGLIKSLPDAIAKILGEYCDDATLKNLTQPKAVCPRCGSPMRLDSACRGGTCVACGYSKCE